MRAIVDAGYPSFSKCGKDGAPAVWERRYLCFQTASGRLLTANDGGLPGEGSRTDTSLEDIWNFEKFTIENNGEGSNLTARIRTYSGTYLNMGPDAYQGIVTVLNANQAKISWQFQVFSL